eukprot:gene7322-biopygen3263
MVAPPRVRVPLRHHRDELPLLRLPPPLFADPARADDHRVREEEEGQHPRRRLPPRRREVRREPQRLRVAAAVAPVVPDRLEGVQPLAQQRPPCALLGGGRARADARLRAHRPPSPRWLPALAHPSWSSKHAVEPCSEAMQWSHG